MIKDFILKIYTNCIPIKGYNRGIILDLQLTNFHYVPNSLIDFISSQNNKIVDLSDENEDTKTLLSYVNFLRNKNYLLSVSSLDELKLFPKLDLNYNMPFVVDNISVIDNIKSLNKLSQLNCYYIKYNINLILTRTPTAKDITQIGKIINFGTINSISIFLIKKINKNIDFIISMLIDTNIPCQLHYYSTKKSTILSTVNTHTDVFKYYKPISFFNNNQSQVQFKNHKINNFLFLESQKMNTYFNKRLFIDQYGNIKRSFDETLIFGNIFEINLQLDLLLIITAPAFRKFWSVHKKLIDVCKQCEFRHMCVDNRLPLKRTNKEWYMEYECNYNPYISKWKNEEGYKTLAECGVITNKAGFKINRKKIKEINNQIWN